MPGGAPLCPQQDMAVCTPQADPAARVRVGEYGRVGGVYGRCCADAQAPRPPGRAVRAGAHHEECQEAMGRGASPKLTKKEIEALLEGTSEKSLFAKKKYLLAYGSVRCVSFFERTLLRMLTPPKTGVCVCVCAASLPADSAARLGLPSGLRDVEPSQEVWAARGWRSALAGESRVLVVPCVAPVWPPALTLALASVPTC